MPHSSMTMTPQHPQVATHIPSSAPVSSGGSGANANGQEEHLVSALHAALHSLSDEHDRVSPGASAPATGAAVSPTYVPKGEGPSPREKAHPVSLDISVANDQLYLRGTGVDVEPTLLTGNVVLHLSESTSIKQIILVFRGKARVPNNPHDPHVLNSSPSQYIVCNHEWTFLEGEKKHSHTLKAGRHLFPFELRLGGSLPSSLATYVNGGASISYKLRATTIRPGLSTNLTTSLPITLTRTFAPESLEYQQTLEIENTWPEKVMYALMIPHKAWAAGDELMALLKFAPLVKGVRVISVTTHLCETTKTLARGGHLEKVRNVVTRKHELVNGRAVCVEEQQRKRLHNALQNTLGEQGRQGQGIGLSGVSSQSGGSSPGLFAGAASAYVSGTSTPVLEGYGIGLSLARSGTRDSNGSGSGSLGSSGSGSSNNVHPQEDTEGGESEFTTTITVPLPASLTPSHSLDPIIVSYRIRWSVLLGNLDGHTSELRCSLPVHILDYSLLDEARTATLATRRLLFGGEDAPRAEGEEDAQLPSYPSHVRDRVALNLTLPEASALRPFSTLDSNQLDSGATTPAHEAAGGGAYALSDFPGFTQDPGAGSGMFAFGAPLSRAQTQNAQVQRGRNVTPPDSSSAESSRSGTRPSSRHADAASSGGGGGGGWGPFNRSRLHSRANSRAASPERGGDHSHSPQHALPGTAPAPSPGVSRADETHVHVSNAASRQPHGLFSVMMKPLTSLSSFAAPWHASSHSAALAQHFQNTFAHAREHAVRQGSGSFGGVGGAGGGGGGGFAGTVGSATSASTGDLRSLVLQTPGGLYANAGAVGSRTVPATPGDIGSAVPDYFTASHSGSSVPPLETLRGLPTYEDSEAQAQAHGHSPGATGVEQESAAELMRSFSDSDLVAHFARVRPEAPRVR